MVFNMELVYVVVVNVKFGGAAVAGEAQVVETLFLVVDLIW